MRGYSLLSDITLVSMMSALLTAMYELTWTFIIELHTTMLQPETFSWQTVPPKMFNVAKMLESGLFYEHDTQIIF